MTGGFRRLEESELYRGALVTVARGRFQAPDGSKFERDVVHHPGAVAVVPVVRPESGEVLLVRQYRAPLDRDLLEIPAGKRDVAAEPPADTARRELIEEVGYRAGRLELLAQFYNSPGFCDEHSFAYLALELSPTGKDAQGVEEQHMTVEHIELDDVPALIRRGAIIDAKTIIGLTLARNALG